jgi:large subunit ribosomal protein L9
MNVILREEVDNLGNAGEVVTVKAGYARNYLLPRGLAVRADNRNVKAFEHQKRAMEARRGLLEATARDNAKGIEKVGRVVVNRACGVDGKLYGSVTNKDVTEALAARGVEISRKQILLGGALKELGDFDIEIKLGQGVRATVKVSVEPDAASAEAMANASLEAAQRAPETDEADE